MKDEITSLRVFLEVARRKSFAGAAAHFGMSRAAVSKHVAGLEASLQARLLNRTTQQMSLTRAGMHVVDSGAAILQGLDDMRGAVTELSKDLSGVVRVGVAPSFGTQRLLPVVAAFCERYTDIELTLTLLTHRKEETFVSEGLDVGVIITSTLKDATHSAMSLAPAPQALVASPAYLQRHSAIKDLDDLVQHNCLINVHKSPTGIWNFTGPGGPVSQRVHGSLRSDFGEALKAAAINGMGISMHPYYMIHDEIERGLLEVVLPQWQPQQLHVFAIYSRRGNVPVRVRAFLDFLKAWVLAHPQWPNAAH